jgi:hypothetical protein
VLNGTFATGGQKHFYLETQAAFAIPSEDGKMVVWAGNQNPRRTQTSIASALGVPINKVDARVRRVGGAYGGKLNAHLPTCVVAAVAARKMRAPVAVHHERCDDMSSGGHRAPVSATWSCAIDPASGVINSCHMHLEYDSGCVDGAAGDLGMAIQWSDNCYYHEDFACEGAIVLSPRVGNTAVRAPGVIQSIALHEFIIEAAAEATQRDAEEIRDAALRAAGLLSEKMYGRSVFPPQPASITSEGTYGAFTWTTSTGEDRYRRSLYTFAKRTAPFAFGNTFDAPTGDICIVRRDKSNTPLQALSLLNDVTMMEAAQALGTRLAALPGTPEQKITDAFLRCFSRGPDAAETAAVLDFQRKQEQRLTAAPESAKSLAGPGPDESAIPRATWTAVARALMNMDEFVTKS